MDECERTVVRFTPFFAGPGREGTTRLWTGNEAQSTGSWVIYYDSWARKVSACCRLSPATFDVPKSSPWLVSAARVAARAEAASTTPGVPAEPRRVQAGFTR
jgi:hypothetical protein